METVKGSETRVVGRDRAGDVMQNMIHYGRALQRFEPGRVMVIIYLYVKRGFLATVYSEEWI